ncbi:hypothetical protein PYW07_003600 [Mythimna separata]|uniref:DUF4776 domain-containing protein n=1 Tax=Mythimna separata TaxID=271217 RepID=A0AAD7YNM8_MYTSE|nr:hypothetical protein PYW07_003600 [Mythimna separata]
MAVRTAMFLFEVVVESVKGVSVVDTRGLVIKSEFSNIFSLELRDPKQLHIVMPEPLPLPPAPVKKGKKAPKPKKPKKGKKGKEVEPPPEPVIQSGQSVLFPCSAEILIQNMENCPLELSLWSKEEHLVFIGTTTIPWDPKFITYLSQIANCEVPPPVTLKDEYNVFEEGQGKVMAKLAMQVKLSYLGEKLTTAFRTLSEDASVRKFLYTGINSKTTSYMCTLKSTDEDFEKNCKKIENKFIVDRPKPHKIVCADYKNAPAANLAFFNEKDYCCMGHADKPPESIYKSPETCPDIDFIIDYVRKIIVSCNDNLRMLTPRPTITPRIKATDIDRLCYCRETAWPKGAFAERFKKKVKSGPCPICIDSGEKPRGSRAATFDIANIRGPCGKPECKIARDIRAYIEDLVDEDNQEFKLEDLVGPCGTKECTLVSTIQDFLRHEGVFTHEETQEGLSTQCACIDKMKSALTKRESCESICSKDCENATSSEASVCEGMACPFSKSKLKVYNVFYFTVEYDFEHNLANSTPTSGTATPTTKTGSTTPKTGSTTPKTGSTTPKTNPSTPKSSPPKSASAPPSEKITSGTSSPVKLANVKDPQLVQPHESKVKICNPECPTLSHEATCSKGVCRAMEKFQYPLKCIAPVCPNVHEFPPSPADSKIEIRFDEIHNMCCVQSCDTAEKVKDFIAEGVTKKQTCKNTAKDPCYCDCVCTFKFSKKTTYCAVCGGYECLGDDMRYEPEHIKPHPCPVYHKMYDRKYIKVKSPWPEDNEGKDTPSTKSSRATRSGDKFKFGKGKEVEKKGVPEKKVPDENSKRSLEKKEIEKPVQESAEEEKVKQKQKVNKGEGDERKKKKPKVERSVALQKAPLKKEDLKYKYHYPPVPSNMGWNWVAEDVPGMKVRPNWKPGAANAILVRRYRQQRSGGDILNKKKRALMQRKKKIEMKPTLIVTKRDGEFTVQMEVFKKFSKERLLFQYPYDEKPPLVYTIGKTEEEKRKIQQQRDRRERRETRRKSRLLQSTFRDRCQEICLKAYNQAIGVLPLPDPNSPDCPCAGKPLHEEPPIVDSCSCSDTASTIASSDSDHDEWVIEFTPPAARWDTKAKHPPVQVENETQYTYLDYKVKVLDKSGNQVIRFFKGPDGKQECSDLGGFWGTLNGERMWLEINKDGYIGPDERWVPMNFTGPDGMLYSSEEGFFTDTLGRILKIGVDGYVDKDGKWAWYSKKKEKGSPGQKSPKSKSTATASTVDPKKGLKIVTIAKPQEKDKQNKEAVNSKGKTSNSHDKKKVALTSAPAPALKQTKNSENVKKPQNNASNKGPVVMNLTAIYDPPRRQPRVARTDRKPFMDRKALARYREIIEELRAYDDLGEIKPPPKANRASNTPLSQLSTFTVHGYTPFNKKIAPQTAEWSCEDTNNFCSPNDSLIC